MKTGRYNIGVGLLVMAGFMLYGFMLIYLRDFARDKEAWVARALLPLGGVILQQVRKGGVLSQMMPLTRDAG